MAPAGDPSAGAGLFTDRDYQAVNDFYASRPELAPTPTRRLDHLARALGLGQLVAKDETARFGLNAFKLLGARFAVETLIARGVIRPGATLACASEGNHGRAVARAARDAGCAARVYMAADAAEARASAIAREGAEVVRV
ncbi:MAG: pyridoxal-phosphate dependent enzyme, partial [Vicinamibacterales bacterium]